MQLIPKESQSKRLFALVDEARGRLAELEVAYTVEKAKLDSLQARLFERLRSYSKERDRLRLVVNYRRQLLEVLRQGGTQAEQIGLEFEKAKARTEADYEETAQIFRAKRELSNEEQIELRQLWKKLVALYHPDRFSSEPEKLETYGKLTAAINQAKDNGDVETLRQIASDPYGFILRQGWRSLDFSEEEHADRLQSLLVSLEEEIAKVLEATRQLHESDEFELYNLTSKSPEMLEKVIAQQIESIEAESDSLKQEAAELAKKIENLNVQSASGSI